MSYRPQLADLPDQQLWRIRPDAGYGPLDTAARGKIDLGKVRIRSHGSAILACFLHCPWSGFGL